MATETEGLEDWRPVPGFDRYEVSNLGRVRSKGHLFWHELNFSWTYRKPKVLRVSHLRNGYRAVSLYEGSRHEVCSVHALVLDAFTGPRPEGFVARHLNGDRLDNRACNLAWGTPAENSADMIAHGRSLRGEKHHMAKLTWTEVHAIRTAKASGAKRKDLADKFGVSRATITDIISHRHWKEAV